MTKMGLYWLMAQVECWWVKCFLGDYTQKFIDHNEILNNLTRNLLEGNRGQLGVLTMAGVKD